MPAKTRLLDDAEFKATISEPMRDVLHTANTYDHVLVVTKSKNVYLAVIVDLKRNDILGHRLLDLNQEYGLTTRH
jgi:hypothetical protein